MRDDALLGAIEEDFETAALDDKRKAMLRYVAKLTRAPQTMVEGDVNELRRLGYSDRDVLEICEVAAYYAYVNRIADGLGVTLEAELQD